MSDRASPPVALWGRGDRLLLTGAVAVGLVLLGAGYWGVSGTRVFDDQVSAARLAAGGVLLAQAGFVVGVIRGRRALGRRLARTFSVREAAVARPAPATTGNRPVATAAMSHYHRDSCAFMAGKAGVAATSEDHERAGRRPCGICRP